MDAHIRRIHFVIELVVKHGIDLTFRNGTIKMMVEGVALGAWSDVIEKILAHDFHAIPATDAGLDLVVAKDISLLVQKDGTIGQKFGAIRIGCKPILDVVRTKFDNFHYFSPIDPVSSCHLFVEQEKTGTKALLHHALLSGHPAAGAQHVCSPFRRKPLKDMRCMPDMC
jgi:hypothetical protein